MTIRISSFWGDIDAIFAFLVVVWMFVRVFAIPAHAGVLSFLGISQLFSKDEKPALSYKNSQTLSLLSAAVNPDPNPAKGGADITVIGDGALLADTGPSGVRGDGDIKPSLNHISIYVVRKGDSLSEIADMFGVSADTIRWANDLGISGTIKEGETLVILPVSGVQHTVKKGDTISSIASKYGARADEVEEFNQLSHGELSVGETIIIPNGKLKNAPSAPKSTTPAPSSYASGDPSQEIRRVLSKETGPSYDGYYIFPVPGGRVTQGRHSFNAIDIGSPVGTPIVAAAAGTVLISRDSGWNGGYGNYIVIAHENGTQTLYGHNSQNIVYIGQSVYQGQVIGYVGNTGRSTGPHVHFEVRGAQNPFVY